MEQADTNAELKNFVGYGFRLVRPKALKGCGVSNRRPANLLIL